MYSCEGAVKLLMGQHVFGGYKRPSSVDALDLMIDRIQAFLSFLKNHRNWILEREVGKK